MNMTLQQIIDGSNNIVFFGGAGVSTESGIPDFRSVDGLYSLKYKYPPETILSKSFFFSNTIDFYEFYRNKILFHSVEPNKAHIALARLEQAGKLKAVITQNIDGLHQAAGSKNVLELHGTIHKNYCIKCNTFYDMSYIRNADTVSVCSCGGIIKPDVVLYEESLNDEVVNKAVGYISRADVLIIGGTSLAVYPAAGLINYYKGNKLILINKSETHLDSKANMAINGKIGEVLGEIRID